MKIENVNVRVLKTPQVTEVYITANEPLMNHVIRMPADAQVESGTYSLELVPSPPAAPAEEPKQHPHGTIEAVQA